VLLVDDEPAICDVSRIFLERQGNMEVVAVRTVSQAVEALEGRALRCDRLRLPAQ
jgi:Response regulator receiver domain.